jgi:hypothetical protein
MMPKVVLNYPGVDWINERETVGHKKSLIKLIIRLSF